jgi:hypothetical protein
MSCSDSLPRRGVLGGILLALLGCATEYRPRGAGRAGFEEERLGARTWVVRVGPGWPNEEPRLGHFALYRAAEIATANGLRYFTVLEGGHAIGDIAAYTPDAPMPDPIERERAHDPTWSQRNLGIGAGGRQRHVTLRFRLLVHDELPTYKAVLDADKVRARLARVVGR